jgi:hypothetical protein
MSWQCFLILKQEPKFGSGGVRGAKRWRIDSDEPNVRWVHRQYHPRPASDPTILIRPSESGETRWDGVAMLLGCRGDGGCGERKTEQGTQFSWAEAGNYRGVTPHGQGLLPLRKVQTRTCTWAVINSKRVATTWQAQLGMGARLGKRHWHLKVPRFQPGSMRTLRCRDAIPNVAL